tara:strand:+ start:9051 stop:9275 length:225 start_codon:yes stop_codon:yes gene_type:complete
MEIYDPNKIHFWVLNQKLPKNNKKRFKGNTLYYCKPCNHTWEKGSDRVTSLYTSLPTYGLKRKTCHYCKLKKRK